MLTLINDIRAYLKCAPRKSHLQSSRLSRHQQMSASWRPDGTPWPWKQWWLKVFWFWKTKLWRGESIIAWLSHTYWILSYFDKCELHTTLGIGLRIGNLWIYLLDFIFLIEKFLSGVSSVPECFSIIWSETKHRKLKANSANSYL